VQASSIALFQDEMNRSLALKIALLLVFVAASTVLIAVTPANDGTAPAWLAARAAM
jgi:fatty acid desaturase